METAKIFDTGRSQAVRLPKQFRFSEDEVYIKKVGDVVMLIPKEKLWDTFMLGLNGFSTDFMEGGREQGNFERREVL